MNNNFKILVVDDTPELLDISVRTLKKADFNVFSAADGAECIEVIRKQKPDLILLDVVLPDINGQDLTKTIKQDPELSSIYIILISSIRIQSQHASEGLELGADGYINRPVEGRELVARIEAACRILEAERIAEEKFVQSWKATFNAIDKAILLLDSKGVIKQVNKSISLLLKKDESELIGRFCHEVLPCAVKCVKGCLFKKVIQNGEKEFFQMPFNANLYEVIVEPLIDETGNLYGAVHIMSNITESMQRNEELTIAKEKAQENIRLKAAFLKNMSHEIRTPLNGILGFTELLKRPNLSDTEQQSFIGIIEKSGYRLLDTINEILYISQIDTGLVEMYYSEVNMNEQLDELFSFFKPEAETKGLTFNLTRTLHQKDAVVKTDRTKVRTILSNLIKNAIKYTFEGGIEFGCNLLSNHESPNNDLHSELVFFVKDTGIGIPVNRQQAIFDRFVQADIEDKAAYQGSGLGLSISKAFANMLGGTITLESREGEGSIFYFSLPV